MEADRASCLTGGGGSAFEADVCARVPEPAEEAAHAGVEAARKEEGTIETRLPFLGTVLAACLSSTVTGGPHVMYCLTDVS